MLQPLWYWAAEGESVLKDPTFSRRMRADQITKVGLLGEGFVVEATDQLTPGTDSLDHLVARMRELAPANPVLAELLPHAQEALQATGRVSRALRDFRSLVLSPSQTPRALQINDVVLLTVRLAARQVQPVCRIVHELLETRPIQICEAHLAQVTLNLLLNSAQACESLGRKRDDNTVILRTFQDKNWIYLEVCDNGPGLSEEVQPRLFDAFFTTRKTQGAAGLGLYVSRGIVESYGGKLELKNHPEGGAVATVRLPFET